MSLTESSGNMYMPVAPAYANGGSNAMWGDGSFWIIVLFLFALMGNGWNGGFGGNGAALMNTNNDVQRGFDQQAVMSGLNGIQSSLATLAQGQCSGFAGVTAAVQNGFQSAEIAANARQMADMNQNFQMQSALQNCCCENRAATADLKYTIAQEASATRAASAQNTQAILDKLCQQEIDALKTQVSQLQTQLNMANLAASQGNQTSQILADNLRQTQALEQYLNPAPVPAYVVANPNGCNCGTGTIV